MKLNKQKDIKKKIRYQLTINKSVYVGHSKKVLIYE